MTEIMGASHYCSHMLAQADRDIEAANSEGKKLKRLNEDLESSLAETELARDAAMLARDEAVQGREAANARIRVLEAELYKQRHDRLAMEHLYSDVKAALAAEQSAREDEREKMETDFQRRLDEAKRIAGEEQHQKEQSLRAKIKEDIYAYGVGFRRSAMFLIREKHPGIDLSGIDFCSLRGAEIPDPDDGEEEEEAEPIQQEVTMDDLFGAGDEGQETNPVIPSADTIAELPNESAVLETVAVTVPQNESNVLDVAVVENVSSIISPGDSVLDASKSMDVTVVPPQTGDE